MIALNSDQFFSPVQAERTAAFDLIDRELSPILNQLAAAGFLTTAVFPPSPKNPKTLEWAGFEIQTITRNGASFQLNCNLSRDPEALDGYTEHFGEAIKKLIDEGWALSHEQEKREV